jgi:hypothetical protein
VIGEPRLVIDALRPQDAADMVRLALLNGRDQWYYPKDGFGTTVRDARGSVRAFCVMRELPYGFVADQFWCDGTREGIAGLGMLSRWMQRTVQQVATERGEVISLGGIVTLENTRHKAALIHRGFAVVAEVLARKFLP